MGALKGSVTVRRYVVRGDAPREKARLVKGVRAHAFVPIDPAGDVVRSHGWACVEDPQDLELSSEKIFFGDALALALRVDTLKPPAALVRRLVEERLRLLGRRPSRAEKQALKQEIVKQLRPRMFPAVKTADLVWLMDPGRVMFFSHAKALNELAIDHFAKSFGLELVPEGPGLVAGRGALPTALKPSIEMVYGFPGLPGRPTAGDAEDADA